MAARWSPRRSAVLVLAVLALSTAPVALAPADPTDVDNLDGTRTANWPLLQAGDYSAENVTLLGGAAGLNETTSLRTHTSDADFLGGTFGPEVEISGNAVTLVRNDTSLVQDGTFDLGADWTFLDSLNGSVQAFWDPAGVGAFGHSFAANEFQYDSMDSGCAAVWQYAGTAGFVGCTQDLVNPAEGLASTNLTFDPVSQSETGGLRRNDPGVMDLSMYDRVVLWLDTGYAGPDTLVGNLWLMDGGGYDWSSPSVVVTPGWKEFDFDLAAFAASGGSLSTVDLVQFNFTGVLGPTSVRLDDVRFVAVDLFNESASISQLTDKPFATPPVPGEVLLDFEYEVVSSVNLSYSSLISRLDSTPVWSQAGLTGGGPFNVNLDVSSVVGGAGTYALSFEAQVAANWTGNVEFTLELDNVSLRAPRQRNATYMSPVINASTDASWGPLFWNATVPPETSLSLMTRSGPVEDPSDPSWSAWDLVAGPGDPVLSPPAPYLQYRAFLNTTNASVGPSLDDVTLQYIQYVSSGWIETASYTPTSTLLGWREFVATASTPPGTDIAYAFWNTSATAWTAVSSGENLSYVAQPAIQFRAVLTTTDTTVSPTLLSLNITYAALGPLASIQVSPPTWAGPSGGSLTFQATGYDPYGRTVVFAPTWETDDPLGTVVGGTYVAGQGGRWTIWANDTASSVSGTATVWVAAGPQINGTLPSVSIPEDTGTWSLDLTPYAAPQADANDTLDSLRWTVTGARDDLYALSGVGDPGEHALLLTTIPDAFGDSQATFWLEDAHGLTDSQDLWINLTSVNDPPLFGGAPNLFVQADIPYTFDYGPYASDVDHDDASLVLTTSDPGHTEVAGLQVTYTYPSAFAGDSVPVTLTVSDGEYQAQDLILVNITDNAPPVLLQPLPDLQVQRGETLSGAFDLDDFFADPEEATLLMSAHGTYSHLAISIHEDHSVDFTSLGDWTGVEEVVFRATDPLGATAEDAIRVTIVGANLPPVLAPLPQVRVAHDVLYVFDLAPYVDDPDTPASQLQVSVDVANVTVDGLALRILMTGWSGQEYTIPVQVTVDDGEASDSGTLEVFVGDVAPPAVVLPLPDITFPEDTFHLTPFAVASRFKDLGGSPTFLFFGNLEVSVILNATGHLNLSAARDWFGTETLTVRAIRQGDQAFVEDSFRVVVTPVNDPPALAPLPPQRVKAGEVTLLDLAPYLSDVDDPLSSLQVQTSSAQIQVVGLVLVLNFTEARGPEDVQLIVTDGEASAQAVAYLVYTRAVRPYSLDDVFLITRGGKLVLHHTTRLRADMDEDVLAGMLTAIQEFVKDAFREDAQHLKRFEFGEKCVLIEPGEHLYVAAIYKGGEPEDAAESLRDFVGDLEERYASILPHWTGEPSALPGVGEMASTFSAQRRYRTGDWLR